MIFQSYVEAPIVWHVVFHPRDNWKLWPGKYRHVSLAGYCNDTWLHVDLGRLGASIAPIYHYQEVENYLSMLLTHYEVLRVPPRPRRPSASRFMWPLNCVTLTTHVLGMPNCALLPDGLHRTLLKNYGATRLNEAESPPRDRTTES